MKKSKLIVLEGIDGSGKSTQHRLLVRYLRSQKKTVKTVSFPRHGKKFFGVMVDQYLAGKFGPTLKIDPYLASALYAFDRWEVSSKIRNWIKKDYYIIPDRYTTSNLGHQLSKLMDRSDKVKNKFIVWDREMEYKYLDIPKPDLVIYLYIDINEVKRLLNLRGRNDSHESDMKYLKNSQLAYNYVCANSRHWIKLNCMKNKKIMSRKNIHKSIIKIIKEHNET